MADVFEETLRGNARWAQHAENRPRNAAAFAQMVSLGQGPYEWPEPIDFGMTFVKLPWVSVGHYLDADDLRAALGLPSDSNPPFPLISSFVTEWDRDENGLYTGAWVGTRVYFPLIPFTDGTTQLEVPAELAFEVTHMFRFEAVGMKDVPVQFDD